MVAVGLCNQLGVCLSTHPFANQTEQYKYETSKNRTDLLSGELSKGSHELEKTVKDEEKSRQRSS